MTAPPGADDTDRSDAARRGSAALLWAELMRRTFGFDVLASPPCGERMRLITLIDQAAVAQRVLRHVILPSDVPGPRQRQPVSEYERCFSGYLKPACG